MKTLINILCALVLSTACLSQPIPQDSLYLAQPRPGNTPVIFQLPVNGSNRPVERIWITNDGKEIYYSQLNTYPPSVLNVYCYKYMSDKWQGPFEVVSGFFAPSLSPNDSILYVQSNFNYTDSRAFYCTRTPTGWSSPELLFSFQRRSHYTQLTDLGNYFTSTLFPPSIYGDLAKVIISGNDTTFVSLGMPVSSAVEENDFFIARNESYIIFARHEYNAAGDMYISFSKTGGGWTNPKKFGPNINIPSPTWEYGCFVTNDNKYLFFTRGNNSWNSYYTYWVKIDNIIDSLRNTNYTPYLLHQIPNMTDTAGNQFNYSFPDSTFIDDNGNNTLTYSATRQDGSPLPGWLHFDSETRTFSGTPLYPGDVYIRLKAKDNANDSAVCNFTLYVPNHTSINRVGESVPGSYALYQNYPNPFNPETTIRFSVPVSGFVSLKIHDILGKEVSNLFSGFLQVGVYKTVFNAGSISSGIYFYTLLSASFHDMKKMAVIK